MSEKILIVVDMQNDFVTGPLGSPEAVKIVPAVAERIREFDGTVLFTKDTHEKNYLETQEGALLPVEHCIRGTEGWELVEEIAALQRSGDCPVYEKNTFGCVRLAEAIKAEADRRPLASIELIGVCTDICVVSNALLLKAYLPEVPVSVTASCCAGVTPQKHEAALLTMESCQILIV